MITFDEFIKAIAIPATGSVDEKLDCEFQLLKKHDDETSDQIDLNDNRANKPNENDQTILDTTNNSDKPLNGTYIIVHSPFNKSKKENNDIIFAVCDTNNCGHD